MRLKNEGLLSGGFAADDNSHTVSLENLYGYLPAYGLFKTS
ncbi:hypothetical protein [Paenibacillus mendelii]|uniref:Uncharacterized protein n=1 Tax=Paenibacillus mendelii TaxID=206163 RepID=A0ABV6JKS7_9BACL|nr:hypothetical protein [Paenibacillus mendelii]MCQ6560635.1 hypothetical protein [Paenibacillus mendelii]